MENPQHFCCGFLVEKERFEGFLWLFSIREGAVAFFTLKGKNQENLRMIGRCKTVEETSRAASVFQISIPSFSFNTSSALSAMERSWVTTMTQ